MASACLRTSAFRAEEYRRAVAGHSQCDSRYLGDQVRRVKQDAFRVQDRQCLFHPCPAPFRCPGGAGRFSRAKGKERTTSIFRIEAVPGTRAHRLHRSRAATKNRVHKSVTHRKLDTMAASTTNSEHQDCNGSHRSPFSRIHPDGSDRFQMPPEGGVRTIACLGALAQS